MRAKTKGTPGGIPFLPLGAGPECSGRDLARITNRECYRLAGVAQWQSARITNFGDTGSIPVTRSPFVYRRAVSN